MGKRGPRPTPTAIKLARGAARSTNKNEPQPPTDGIVMPSHLDGVAAEKWQQLLPMLVATKVMTRADVDALARYCDLAAWWLKTRETLREHGDAYSVVNDAGQVKYHAQRPEVAIAHKLSQQLRSLEQDFGLNPSARTSLKVEPIAGDSEVEDILFGG